MGFFFLNYYYFQRSNIKMRFLLLLLLRAVMLSLQQLICLFEGSFDLSDISSVLLCVVLLVHWYTHTHTRVYGMGCTATTNQCNTYIIIIIDSVQKYEIALGVQG